MSSSIASVFAASLSILRELHVLVFGYCKAYAEPLEEFPCAYGISILQLRCDLVSVETRNKPNEWSKNKPVPARENYQQDGANEHYYALCSLAQENLAQPNEKYAQYAHHCWIFWWIRCGNVSSSTGRLSFPSFQRDAAFHAHNLFGVRFRTAAIAELCSGLGSATTLGADNGVFNKFVSTSSAVHLISCQNEGDGLFE